MLIYRAYLDRLDGLIKSSGWRHGLYGFRHDVEDEPGEGQEYEDEPGDLEAGVVDAIRDLARVPDPWTWLVGRKSRGKQGQRWRKPLLSRQDEDEDD